MTTFPLKISSNSTTPISNLPLPFLSISNSNKIPTKRPVYRSIRIYEKTRAKQVQVKLWKTLHCQILQIDQEPAQIPFEYLIFLRRETNPSSHLHSPTFRKCLKSVKKLIISNPHISKNFFKHKLRPETLALSRFCLDKSSLKTLKKSIHPSSLKTLTLGSNHHSFPVNCSKDHSDLLSHFPRLQALYYPPKHIKTIHPPQKIKLPCLKTFSLHENSLHFSHFIQFPCFKHLEHLDLTAQFINPNDFLIHSKLNGLTNLLSLRLNLTRLCSQGLYFDFSILASCKKILSVNLTLSAIEEKSLEIVCQLPALKEFTLRKTHPSQHKNSSSHHATLFSPINLQSLALSLQFDSNQAFFYKYLLNQISVYGTLDLSSSLDKLSTLIQGSFPFQLQRLNLRIQPQEKELTLPPQDSIQNIENFLKQQSTLKSLLIELDGWQAGVLTPIFKAIEENLFGLESFSLCLPGLDKIKNSEFLNLQNLLIKLEKLQTLQLKIPDLKLASKYFSSLINTLKALKSLSRLSLEFDLIKVNRITIKEFISFLYSVKNNLDLRLQVKCLREYEEEIEELLGFKISLWNFQVTV